MGQDLNYAVIYRTFSKLKCLVVDQNSDKNLDEKSKAIAGYHGSKLELLLHALVVVTQFT